LVSSAQPLIFVVRVVVWDGVFCLHGMGPGPCPSALNPTLCTDDWVAEALFCRQPAHQHCKSAAGVFVGSHQHILVTASRPCCDTQVGHVLANVPGSTRSQTKATQPNTTTANKTANMRALTYGQQSTELPWHAQSVNANRTHNCQLQLTCGSHGSTLPNAQVCKCMQCSKLVRVAGTQRTADSCSLPQCVGCTDKTGVQHMPQHSLAQGCMLSSVLRVKAQPASASSHQTHSCGAASKRRKAGEAVRTRP
jgi:hypothetical protein